MSRKGSFSYGSKGASDVTSINRKSGNVDLGIADLGEVVNIAAGGSYAFTLNPNTRHIFFCIGVVDNNICGYLVGCSSTGTVRATKFGTASNISYTVASPKITIKSTSSVCCILHLSYDVPS